MTTDHAESTAHRLGRLMHELRSVAGPSPEDLVGIDLPRHQLRALFIVVKHGPLSVGELADATHASLASTSSLAERLVKSGHLRREGDVNDRRKVLLVATAQGRAIAEELSLRFNERFKRLVGSMSPEGRIALEAGLTDLMRAADELGLRSHPDIDHGGNA